MNKQIMGTHHLLTIIVVIITSISITLVTSDSSNLHPGISKQILENWASKFGGPLYEFGRSVTKYNELQGRFQNSVNSNVQKIHLDKLIVDFTNDVNVVLKEKVEAIRKIMLSTEERAYEYFTTNTNTKLPQTYLNAKKLNVGKDDPPNLYHLVNLTFNTHFGTEVNTSFSSIHVPTSIYEKKNSLLQAIGWSSLMDSVFESNYITNPTLSWQYFGSSEGFLRQWPAARWPNRNEVKTNPDLFDGRSRPWYVGAAASPKNMMILLDISGSMTGLRREIAKHVVATILDTLTANDYVNVYSFSDDINPIVPCWKGKLLQANLETVRTLKDALDHSNATTTSGVANFTSSLNTAFDVLERHFPYNNPNNPHYTSGCNQLLMLVTDGAPYNFEEIFRQRQNREFAVRVFTYLIGRDVLESRREVQYMACANNGYYAHISTQSEVEEKVLQYLPVLARPLVMHRNHTVSWTTVYADVIPSPKRRRRTYWLLRYKDFKDITTTDWRWEWRNQRRQYRRSERYKEFLRRNYDELVKDDVDEDEWVDGLLRFLGDEQDDQPNKQEKKKSTPMNVNFIISASIPVFDKRNETSDGRRIASLLGIVGTDIPIQSIKKIPSPFKLGVGGYSFITDNNGYIIYHPEWRPIFRNELLKPNYNTVDLTEVELFDGDDKLIGEGGNMVVRNNHSQLVEMRYEMFELDRGYRTALPMRFPLEDFRRVSLRSQKYEYMHLRNTPYTLTISAPSNVHQFTGQMELYLERENFDFMKFFEDPSPTQKPKKRAWAVNPEWSYCQYVKGGEEFESKEDLVLHFLKRIERAKRAWKWKNTGVGIKQRHHGNNKNANVKYHANMDGDVYECDRDLIQSLMFDANVTEVFNEKKLWKFDRNDKKLIKLNGATSAFLATRSGLTRWINFDDNINKPIIDPHATSASWYQRAVDRYLVDPDSFVYSVPFHDDSNPYRNDTTLVMATRAVFVTSKEGLQAPVAVVGVNYRHSEWAARFMEITGSCLDTSQNSKLNNYVDPCQKTCDSLEHDCYVLDDSGFVVISEKSEQTGKFFGSINGMVMEMLVNSDVYKRVRVVDYQSVCFQPVTKTTSSGVNRLIGNVLSTVGLIFGSFLNLLISLNLEIIKSVVSSSSFGMAEDVNYAIIEETSDTLHPFLELASINKTRLRPCDKETFLYTYGNSYNTYNFSYHGLLTKCGHASECDGYFNVHFIPHTNLILVVTDGRCPCGVNTTTISMQEVNYPTDPESGCDAGFMAQGTLPRMKPGAGGGGGGGGGEEGSCVRYNANEQEMDCGGAARTQLNFIISVLSVVTGMYSVFLFHNVYDMN